jgi:hypothetical protein
VSKDRKADRHTKPRKDMRRGRDRYDFDHNYDFITIDGEGLSVESGKPQPYVMMVASNGQTIVDLDGLSTAQCFDFLFSLNKKTLWVFGGSYDVNQWLRDLSDESLKRLRANSTHNRTLWGLHPRYGIKHLYGKLFQLTRYGSEVQTLRIWDMLSYVQCSFVKMVKSWKLAENIAEQAEVDLIVRMKEQRSSFRRLDVEDMKAYTLLEMKYLHRAVTKLMRMVEESGYRPDAWYSPGSIAAAALKHHGVPAHRGEIPDELKAIAEEAYHGGRAEIAAIGKIDGPIYRYDIHSAYPAAAVDLPSFADGFWHNWKTGKYPDADDPYLYALMQVTWKHKRNGPNEFGAFPVRIAHGSKRYPYENDEPKWYWASEVAQAMKISNVTVHNVRQWIPRDRSRPFSYLSDLYTQRAYMKQPEHYSSQEIVLKLIMNSTYGKLAQHPIDGKEPRYRHLLWAGMITAHCRAQLLKAIAQGGVISCATDGILSTKPLDLPVSEALGAWEMDVLDWVFLVQSGIYFTSDHGQVVVKSRGVAKTTVDPLAVMSAWSSGASEFIAHQTRFIGYKTMLRQGRDGWRTWQEQDKRIEFTLEPRRVRGKRSGDCQVYWPPKRAESSLADQVLGFEDAWKEERDLLLEQPDPEWVED